MANIKKLFFILFVGAFILTGTRIAFAHFLQIDNTIGSVLHIDPDDNPYVGQPATLTFYLKDTTGKFQLADCNCMLTIGSNNKTLLSEKVSESNEGNNTVIENFTFPTKAIYGIVLTGEPLPRKSFQPFTITYSMRVDRTAAPTTTASWWQRLFAGHTVHYILFGIAIVFAGIVVARDLRAEKRDKINHD